MPLGAGSVVKVDRSMAVKTVLNRGTLGSDEGSQKGFLEATSSSLNPFSLGDKGWAM